MQELKKKKKVNKAVNRKPGERRDKAIYIDGLECDFRKLGVKRLRKETRDTRIYSDVCKAAKNLQDL